MKNSPSPVSVPPVVVKSYKKCLLWLIFNLIIECLFYKYLISKQKINGFGDEGVKTPKLPGISDPSSEEKQNKQEKTDDFNKNKNYNPENHLK